MNAQQIREKIERMEMAIARCGDAWLKDAQRKSIRYWQEKLKEAIAMESVK